MDEIGRRYITPEYCAVWYPGTPQSFE